MTARWTLPVIRKSTYPTPPDLINRRVGVGPSPPQGTLPSDVEVRARPIGGVPCTVCTPRDSRHTAVYFHGGGYRLGSAERSTPFATKLAAATHATVFVVEYRLAPEHPFPAGLHDAAIVYGHLLDEGHRTTIAIGDSAGGGLAAALTVAAATNGLPLPTALVMMSPWLDLSCTAGTFTSRAGTDQLFSRQAAEEAAGMYLQGHDPGDPLVSPLGADLDSWPSCLVLASTEEVLLDDAIAFTARLALAGVPVTSHFVPGVPHAWPAVFHDLPASVTALRNIARFVEGL